MTHFLNKMSVSKTNLIILALISLGFFGFLAWWIYRNKKLSDTKLRNLESSINANKLKIQELESKTQQNEFKILSNQQIYTTPNFIQNPISTPPVEIPVQNNIESLKELDDLLALELEELKECNKPTLNFDQQIDNNVEHKEDNLTFTDTNLNKPQFIDMQDITEISESFSNIKPNIIIIEQPIMASKVESKIEEIIPENDAEEIVV